MKTRPGDQPLPTINDMPFAQDRLIDDIEKRKQVGIQRYGTALQPFNGRDYVLDLYEEVIDAAVYLAAIRQMMEASAEQVVEAIVQVLADYYGGDEHSKEGYAEVARDIVAVLIQTGLLSPTPRPPKPIVFREAHTTGGSGTRIHVRIDGSAKTLCGRRGTEVGEPLTLDAEKFPYFKEFGVVTGDRRHLFCASCRQNAYRFVEGYIQ